MQVPDFLAAGVILPALLLACGLAICFAGYRFFFMYLAFMGALAGGIAGFMLGSYLGSQIAAVVLAVLLGIAGGMLLLASIVVGLFAFGGSLFAIILMTCVGELQAAPKIILGVLAFVVGGVLALVLGRFVIIVGTALQGAAASVFATWSLLSHKDVVMLVSAASRADLLRNLSRGRPGALAVTGAFLFLFVAGLCIQYRHAPRKARVS